MRYLLTALCLASWLAGCTVDPIDLTGKHCPCADGYECVRGSCQPPRWDAGVRPLDAAGPVDAPGPVDAAADGPRPDAGGDAGPDAGPTDAAVDAPMADAGHDAGPTVLCAAYPDAVFCEDFEDGDLAGWSLELFGGGAVENVSTVAHGGSRSMRISTSAASGRAYAHADLSTALTAEAHFRAWYFVPATTSAVLDAFYVMDANTFGVGGYLVSYRRGMGTWYGTTTGVWREGPASVYPLGEWFCLQARIVRGMDTGRIELGTAGTSALLVTGVDLDVDPFQAFLLGVDGEAQPDIEYFVDDVVWSGSPVPCGP